MNRVLRQSTVNSADICGKRVEFQLDENLNLPRRGSVMRTAGTGYHAGVAEAYIQLKGGADVNGLQLDRMIAAAIEDADRDIELADEFDWRYQPATSRQPEIVFNLDDLHKLVADTVTRYDTEARYWHPDRYEVLGVELGFLQPYPGVPDWQRSGTMDLALRDKETGWVHIVDHKLTRKKWYADKASAKSSVQAAWYVSAAQEIFQTPSVTFNYDVMDLGGGFQRFDAHRTELHIETTLARGKLLIDLIEQGGPFQPNTQSFLCNEAYCDYWNHCPFGRALAS